MTTILAAKRAALWTLARGIAVTALVLLNGCGTAVNQAEGGDRSPVLSSVPGVGVQPAAARRSAAESSIAVIGVAASPAITEHFQRERPERALAAALEASGSVRVVPAATVRRIAGGALMDPLLAAFAASGELDDESLQTLMASSLPARRGLLVRLDEDRVEPQEPVVEPVLDESGQVVPDRERLLLSVRRVTSITALLIDLNTGAERLRRSWSVSPVATREYLSHSGDSFVASVAATLANTMVNGLQPPELPPAPALGRSLDSLFPDVARSVSES